MPTDPVLRPDGRHEWSLSRWLRDHAPSTPHWILKEEDALWGIWFNMGRTSTRWWTRLAELVIGLLIVMIIVTVLVAAHTGHEFLQDPTGQTVRIWTDLFGEGN